MAWYLSEVVTDLSPLREVLGLYAEIGSFPEDVVTDEYQRRLVGLLRQTTFNTDHIEADGIPTVYEHDEYKWLASGYHDLIEKLGLVATSGDEGTKETSYQLTDTGNQILNQHLSISGLMRAKLPDWKNDVGIHPYLKIKELLSELKQHNLYPCGGLLLLEVLVVLLELNQPYSHIVKLYDRIHENRIAFYPHMTGEVQFDLIDYSGFLWEKMSEDLSNYHAANYPVRATLHLMMYADELIYGPVPDEIFGLIQYISIP